MAGVTSMLDLYMKSAPTWESFSKLIMTEILDNTPQPERKNVISQLKELKHQSYRLIYRFKPLGKNWEYKIVINGTLDHTGSWESGNFGKIYLFNPPIRGPWNSPQMLGEILHFFEENHTGAEFQSITVKGVNDTDDEEGAFTSYITCTPDGYLFNAVS